MKSLVVALNVVLPMFILMSVGYIGRIAGFFNEESLHKLNRFTFTFLISSTLFKNIYGSSLKESLNPTVTIVFFIGFFISLIMGYVVAKSISERKDQIPVITQGIFRSNVALYGLAVIQFLYNKTSIPVISGALAIMAPTFNIASVLCYSLLNGSKADIREILMTIIKNPLIIACVLAFIVNGINLKLPEFLLSAVSSLSACASPMGLIVLGGTFRLDKFSENIKQVMTTVFFKNFVVPLIGLGIGILMGLRNENLAAILILFATPTAISSYAMAESLGGDGDMAGEIVMLSTAVSVFSVFIFVFGLDYFALL
ncbi:MAG: AEC family transporter [Erysipelotrichaceae bacterium]|nr:AEC family transporter [Erysipelotrichaceae bacterium]